MSHWQFSHDSGMRVIYMDELYRIGVDRAVEIAREVGLTLIGRMRGARFVCLSGEDRLVWDGDPGAIGEEDRKHRRKGAE